jgi:hypothetical protein
MKLKTEKCFLLAIALLFLSAPSHPQDLQRGLKNYQAIMRGEKTLEQLSPQEKNEVILVYSRINPRPSEDEESSNCENARSRARNAASELADYARRLRNCAASEDFGNDCSSEFRRVKNSHSDYESAVSEFSSYCR